MLRKGVLVLIALCAPQVAFAAEGRIPLYGPRPTTDPINAPGSYILTRDLDVAASVSPSVFEIAANNVTIDLDGHSVTSQGGLGTTVFHCVNRTGIRITNGSIYGGSLGFWFERTVGGPAMVQVDHIQFAGQDDASIVINGIAGSPTQAVVQANAIVGADATNPTDWGIALAVVADSRVVENTIRGCSQRGIWMDASDNTAITHNTTSGCVIGIEVSGAANMIQHNISSGNSDIGIYVTAAGNYNSVDWNVASMNANCGISVGSTQSVVTNNRTVGNPSGGSCASSSQYPVCTQGTPTMPIPGISAASGTILCGNVGL